jgi:hypothetical protein
MMHSVSKSAREVNIGGLDDGFCVRTLGAHDALERVVGCGPTLFIVNQSDDLIRVSLEEAPLQRDVSGRLLVSDAAACRANVFDRIAWARLPLPVPVLKHGRAVRTHGRFWRPLTFSVWVVLGILDLPIAVNPGTAANFVLRAHASSGAGGM